LTVVCAVRNIRIMSRIPKRARAVSATNAAKNFGGIVSRVREARAEYIVERGGVPVARIVPVLARRSTVADLVEVIRRAKTAQSQTA
jgi:antitoxin (DNA-binding transcriptional repressor) of toxin-antitoxin stability system